MPVQLQQSGGGGTTLTGTGIARNTGACTELSGDVTTSGSNAATVVKVNGASVPTSKTIVGTNSSGQIVDASSASLTNNTSGTAANLSGTPALPNGTTATTQAALSNDTKLATDAYVDAAVAAGPTTFESAGNGSFLTPWGEDTWPGEGSFSTSATGLTATVFMVKVTTPITLRKSSLYVQTGQTSANYYAAIYTSSKNLVANSQAKFTATATGQQNVTLGTPFTLAPGEYYFYVAGDTAGLALAVINWGSTAVPNMLNTNVTRIGNAANGISGAAVPSSLGTLSTSTSGRPLVMYEA
jgi:hypothetical protein